MKNILFVCTGNACRSAAAEFVLRQLLAEKGIDDVCVDSVGTSNWGANPRDAVMTKVAQEHGYHMEGNTKVMTTEVLDNADLILVMESCHRDKVTSQLRYDHWDRICLFNDYCFGEKTPVEDPYYQSEAIYRAVFDVIERGCKEILVKLAEP